MFYSNGKCSTFKSSTESALSDFIKLLKTDNNNRLNSSDWKVFIFIYGLLKEGKINKIKLIEEKEDYIEIYGQNSETKEYIDFKLGNSTEDIFKLKLTSTDETTVAFDERYIEFLIGKYKNTSFDEFKNDVLFVIYNTKLLKD